MNDDYEGTNQDEIHVPDDPPSFTKFHIGVASLVHGKMFLHYEGVFFTASSPEFMTNSLLCIWKHHPTFDLNNCRIIIHQLHPIT